MRTKKLISVLLVLLLAIMMFITSCGEGETSEKEKDTKAKVTVEQQEEEKTEDSRAADSKEVKKETGKSSAQKSASNPEAKKEQPSRSAATSSTATAKVCYVTVEGVCSSKAITLQGGDTAYSVLKRTGASVVADNSSTGVYVKAINGRFAEGAYGWLYSVNGSRPNVSSSSYSVKSGDTVKWYWGTAF